MLKSDPVSSVNRLLPIADAGDLDAKFQLAVLYSNSDPSKAMDLFSELDAVGFDNAAYHLGRLHWDHDDPEAAKNWYRRAARRADSAAISAALALGILLYRENAPEATMWLERAVASGEPGAASWLASATEDQDPIRAIELYRAAVEEGDKGAYFRIGMLLERARDKKGARAVYLEGAQATDLRCMLRLASRALSSPRERLRWWLRWLRGGGLTRNVSQEHGRLSGPPRS